MICNRRDQFKQLAKAKQVLSEFIKKMKNNVKIQWIVLETGFWMSGLVKVM